MPQEDLHHGGLAYPVRAEQCEDLALLDGEGEVVDHRDPAVALSQTVDFDCDHGVAPSLRARLGCTRGGSPGIFG